MDRIRISATDIDALRYFLSDEDADLAELLARLRREAEPTEAMLAGTALHKALETISPGEFGELSVDGYVFAFPADAEIDLPEIREKKIEREWQVGDCIVTLVGKVDAIHGRTVHDHKFTARYDAERFLGSYQWRVYLDLFGADEFVWNVFEGRQDTRDPMRYTIGTVHRLRMHRYPEMRADIERTLRIYIDFARQHLPEKFTPLLMAG